MKRFDNKIALITGGSRGIGLAVAQAIALEGGTVVICSRHCPENSRPPDNISFFPCDITQPDQVRELIQLIVCQFGKIDYAFNNAGITCSHKKLADSDVNEWKKVIDTNLSGTYNCMKYETEAMLLSGGGVIVNNSSCVSLSAIPSQAAYVASKNAVNGLTQSAALDYAYTDPIIRINAIAPGPILGGMNSEETVLQYPEKTKKKINVTAMKRFGTSKEVAALVLWLFSDESSYITGSIIPIDGGMSSGKS